MKDIFFGLITGFPDSPGNDTSSVFMADMAVANRILNAAYTAMPFFPTFG
ncbi:hypothetical protein [uncultured Flavobacterium sp.]|nr:hypothetical protein [uncultured Flavobacterium sp.]